MSKSTAAEDHDLLIKINTNQEAQTLIMNQVLDEVRKTNGRVRALENIRTDERLTHVEAYGNRLLELDKFAAGLKGGYRATAVLAAVISAVITFLLTIIF